LIDHDAAVAIVTREMPEGIEILRHDAAHVMAEAVWRGAAITSIFAFFHGHSHGTEATAASLIPYAAGFALATAGLHVAGIGLGRFAGGSIGKVALRALGGLAVLGGIFSIVG